MKNSTANTMEKNQQKHQVAAMACVVVACGVALLQACATGQGAAAGSGGLSAEDEKDVVKTVGRVAEPTMAAVAAKPKAPARKISADSKADFEEAVALYNKLHQAGPLKGGDCEKAASAFAEVADDHPTVLEARNNEAAVDFECGKRDEAARIWEKLGNGQKYAPALASLGYFAWQRGDTDEAERYFTRAIEADKQMGSVAARLNLAQILRDRARHAAGAGEKTQLNNQAILHLRTVLALDGNNLQAYANLCFFYNDMGLLEMARLVGNQAIKRADEIATGKFEEEEATSDKAAGKGKGKGKDKKEASEAEPVKAKAATEAGTGYTVEMKKALGLVWNTLGLVALKKKNVTEAIGDFKKAIDNDPTLSESRMNLAALSLNFRDYATAETNFRAVLAAQPKNFEAIMGLGVALRGGRKVEEAETQYLAAQKLDPANAVSYFNMGLLYQDYKGGDKPSLQKAQQFYREFLGRASGSTPGSMKKEASKRIKDVDELFVALEEAAKLQKEADEIQKKAEEQQKKMEEEMKKQGGGAGGGAPLSPPATPAPATSPAPAAPAAPVSSGSAAPAASAPTASATGGTNPPPLAK